MSENNKAPSSAKPQPVYGIMLMFIVLGLTIHPAFFLGAIATSIDSTTSRNHKIAISVFAAFCMTVAFGYSIGKDLAIRDNHAAAVNRDKTP